MTMAGKARRRGPVVNEYRERWVAETLKETEMASEKDCARSRPDLVPLLLDVTIDPGDDSKYPSLQYVLIRGFAAMGWPLPAAASEDMAMAILTMIRPIWQPISTAPPQERVLLYAPPENLSDRPDQEPEYRVARASDFCWATLWARIPKAET